MRMSKFEHNIGASITRREAIRRAVVFSTGAWAAGRMDVLRAEAPRTEFAQGRHASARAGRLRHEGQRGPAGGRRGRWREFAKSLDKPLTAVLAMGDNFYRTITPDRFETDFEQTVLGRRSRLPVLRLRGQPRLRHGDVRLPGGQAAAGARLREEQSEVAVEVSGEVVRGGAAERGQTAGEDHHARRQLLAGRPDAAGEDRAAAVPEGRAEEGDRRRRGCGW